ncbi:MAG: hypothetical protein EZS28_006657 [Streblomastix strix]|uniref:Uncharacterized protein n=1 Tax=Streblomastix strix TaxID=222440 RepID=A0A5J4WSC5_9EUKA|nr:MAG: hypothetical protein EZS28_006657 [Streblomastix strix]
MNFNNINEDQIRNLRKGTRLLQSNPEIKKEKKPSPNRTMVFLDNHISHQTQLKRSYCRLTRYACGLKLTMECHSTRHCIGCSFRLAVQAPNSPLLWIRMERGNRIENHQVRNFILSIERCQAPKMDVIHSKKVLIFNEEQPREYLFISY